MENIRNTPSKVRNLMHTHSTTVEGVLPSAIRCAEEIRDTRIGGGNIMYDMATTVNDTVLCT